ncbi:hypothetical protein K503DRAFT_234281 [Rhizopogon vinicolor AM-OR11-026]|uniref:Uncharacterized protein n=1 Tax=Rhizopogon vinicolor AM-OR11-026 TaxID=1314800 RepID=A0A1B7NDZ2_9AGAM|nr:hypothetical protein K503DRAFT_234281 [Rhizopogon vinicolor AM-OR11-026]
MTIMCPPSESAINRELEVRFGSRANGLKLVERGPETEAVVDVLEKWIKNTRKILSYRSG